MSSARPGLRVIEGGRRHDGVARLHRFQGEQPEVAFTAPHMGSHDCYIAVIPAGTIPGEPGGITVKSPDLTGLMDQLDDLFSPPGTI